MFKWIMTEWHQSQRLMRLDVASLVRQLAVRFQRASQPFPSIKFMLIPPRALSILSQNIKHGSTVVLPMIFCRRCTLLSVCHCCQGQDAVSIFRLVFPPSATGCPVSNLLRNCRVVAPTSFHFPICRCSLFFVSARFVLWCQHELQCYKACQPLLPSTQSHHCV